ncbi:sperm protein associated with the nucleus on the X chromosome C-like [Gorilla gorilla gorilla]|uniref:sperm protein associated with the nucleus on the X chromosome C-like n=1 Tax=Gorilla gorilla gorilla TaxID=9595 RepID=UPI0024464019|nr:sperm protein associated with the nucleus on the X chromosome C-like [Gorilla gorilla gorilla]XP_055232341.1 sperm protein associated with the nucleus on the X chromosome C-like [Gorilla gorilla gorilla]XP_055232342.1 sperm protein associated with the nucleus on the X chromosome C-like [Gorilla gorilla gorilla]
MGQQCSAGGVKRSVPCDSNEAGETMPETPSGDSDPQPAPKKLKTSDSSTIVVVRHRRNVKRTSPGELVNDHSRENGINPLQMEEKEFMEIRVETPAK